MARYLRLRQVCLAAPALEPAVDLVRAVFGLEVCHRDPNVARYGLVNALFVFGHTFLEIVAPTREDTAAGRFIERSGGQGGYMAIFDCDDPAPRRARAEAMGVRIAHTLSYGHLYNGIQLHPRDARATMLEFDHSAGGDSLDAAYWPAGEHWQPFARPDLVGDIAAIGLASPRPEELAAHWSALMDVPLQRTASGDPELCFDLGRARFAASPSGTAERLDAVQILVADPDMLRQRAASAGCPAEGSGFLFCGVRIEPRASV